MKKIIYLLILILCSFNNIAQTVSSSCNAPYNVYHSYHVDADRIVLWDAMFFWYPWVMDSVEVPGGASDTILNALLAVYNATGLPARDYVVDTFNIHTSDEILEMNNFRIAADSNLFWMQQFKNGIFPTGYGLLDSMINTYHFNFVSYYNTNSSIIYDIVNLTSDSCYNFNALLPLFDSIPGVMFAEAQTNIYLYETDDIYAGITPTYVALDYKHVWGCGDPCLFHRTWHFHVDYNCNVTYTGASGNPLPTGILDINDKDIVAVYPNPFNQELSVSMNQSVKAKTQIKLYDIYGRTVLSQPLTSANCKLPTANLSSGIYIYQVCSNNRIIKKGKVVKE